MPERVKPGETGWIDIHTGAVHVFELARPRLAVALRVEGGPPPGGELVLRTPDGAHTERVPISAAAAGDPGQLLVGFEGSAEEGAAYDCLVDPGEGHEPYPLVCGRAAAAHGAGPARLAEAVRLYVFFEGAPQDRAPARRHVSLALPDVFGEVFRAFVSDEDGLLCVPPRSGPPREPAWVELPPAGQEPRTLRLAAGRTPPAADGQPPPEEAVLTAPLERFEGPDGERRYAVRIPRDPRLCLPIQLGPLLGPQAAAAARAFLRANTFEALVDGEPVECGAQVDPQGRIEVVLRVARGVHEVVISSRATGAPDGPRTVYRAARLRVR